MAPRKLAVSLLRYNLLASNLDKLNDLSKVASPNEEGVQNFKIRYADLENIYNDFVEKHVEIESLSTPEEFDSKAIKEIRFLYQPLLRSADSRYDGYRFDEDYRQSSKLFSPSGAQNEFRGLNLANERFYESRSVELLIARTYDPLGWIAPVILQGKLLMQRLWALGIDWDVDPPQEIVKTWNSILSNLTFIENIKFERYYLLNEIQHCSLHGFADASEAGYGAAVYLRVVDSSGRVKLSLMMAKSRVAPIKTKLTIPKLELCGAALVTKILDNVFYSIRDNVEIHDMVCWTDSTIVLSWLQTPPHLLQTFEGNRVSRIINCGFKIKWRHLPSQMNPADVISRGCNGAELLMHPLWWGPEWLQNAEKFWPQNLIKTEHDLPGLFKRSTVAHICAHELKFELIERTRAKPAELLMSDLPADRVTSSGVFNTVQTDFAGKSLLAVPEYDWDETPMSRLSRFQVVQAISQHFWRKWNNLYLHQLQMRNKWFSVANPPKVGDLVLIKKDNLPSLKWRRGRIEEMLPGKDGVVRVVILRTQSGKITRPVVKICRLPIDT
ncbi:hypothetical protein EVAR_20535_1 [Eumeta japonica]|uniref:DUF5641 domain-containing protein n=1 Tax=Eumeta variegata TaxID=151549 RepID=A0A4C1VLV8_EUMVA|nr:hypothetical protein EVAR_20535_1 [Eumeta japonica]